LSTPPDNLKIYHITHVDNLPQIARAGAIWSDAKRIELGLAGKVVGMQEIKRRRLEELDVGCHAGTKVGEYVPFYFCPRSIMLYILFRGNHPDLDYREGQGPIVHLVADLRTTVAWADPNGVRWAFSDRNAGSRPAQFFKTLDRLDKIDWAAVTATDFRDAMVKEGKQGEFLMFGAFPWQLVEKIGVIDKQTEIRVNAALGRVGHIPVVSVERGWYY
jgi:hypothetical protein